jgi:uncharacterized protein (TIGR02145 family)
MLISSIPVLVQASSVNKPAIKKYNDIEIKKWLRKYDDNLIYVPNSFNFDNSGLKATNIDPYGVKSEPSKGSYNKYFWVINKTTENNFQFRTTDDIKIFRAVFPNSSKENSLLSIATNTMPRINLPELLNLYRDSQNQILIKQQYINRSSTLADYFESIKKYPGVEKQPELSGLTKTKSLEDISLFYKTYPNYKREAEKAGLVYLVSLESTEKYISIFKNCFFENEIKDKAINFTNTLLDIKYYLRLFPKTSNINALELRASNIVKTIEDLRVFTLLFPTSIQTDAIIAKLSNNVDKKSLEQLIISYPNSKNIGLLITKLVDKTDDIQTLNNYMVRFSANSNSYKIKEKIDNITSNEKAKSDAYKAKMAKIKYYETIKVGKYELMATNLDVTHYRNGEPIQKAQSVEDWKKVTRDERSKTISDNASVSPVYCDHPEGAEYGKFYNWSAFADERNIAPEGWRDPTIKEWEEICKIIQSNSSLWKHFNNSGYRDTEGLFKNGYHGGIYDSYIWLFSDSFGAHRQYIHFQSWNIFSYNINVSDPGSHQPVLRGNGLSIRLIRDK